MQKAYITKLMEIAQTDKEVVHCLADSGTGYDEIFRHNFPSQIFNFGIAEENMVAAAAGMATVGKIPFVFTAGAFLAYRSLEFIRNDICFQNLNVKIVGMGSGLSWSSLGPTHHTTEDIAILRSLPNLTVLSPSTPKQVSECVELAYKIKGPVYIKIEMNNEKEFFEDDYKLELLKDDILKQGNDILIYTTGPILEEVYDAVEMLEKDNIKALLVNVTSIKPFNKKSFIAHSNDYKMVFTIEEHSIFGGLGSILSEIIAKNDLHCKLYPIGLNYTFANSYGSYKDVRKANKLDSNSIYLTIKEVLKNERI